MNIYDSKGFGQVLKNQRKKLGYTQKQVSEVTGFSVSFISDIENGKATIELGRAITLTNILGLDISIEARG